MLFIIYYMVLYIAEACIAWQYCSSIFYSKYSKKTEGIILLAGYGVLLFTGLWEIGWLNTIAFILINFIIIVTIYQVKWHSAIFHALIIFIIMALSELIVVGVNSQILVNFFATHDHNASLILSAMFSKLIYFFVLQFIIHFLRGEKEKSVLPDKYIWFLSLVPFISVIIFLTFYTISLAVELSVVIECMVSVSSILLLVLNLLIFWIYNRNQKRNLEYMQLQLQLQKECDTARYYQLMIQQDENQKILIHDIKKHLQSINDLNEQGEQTEVSAYIDRIIHSSDLQDSIRVCDNVSLNALLCRYIQVCREKNIDFRVDVRKGLLTSLTYHDMTALFSNLLDNAVESAAQIPDSYIDLSITWQEKASLTVLSLINSCRENLFSGKTGRLISTKKDSLRHGYGIRSIKRVVEDYHGDMQMYYDDGKMEFHTIITLKSKILS